MRTILALLLAFFLSQGIMAQSHVEAKKLLQESSAVMKSYPAMEIRFNYTIENNRVDPPIVQEQAGTIAIKGDNYRLKTDALEQLRIGNKLYNILHQDKEIQFSEYEEEDMGMSPSRLLSFYEKGYSYKLGGKEDLQGRSIKYVILKPVASEEIDKIMIGIDGKSKEIYSMKQWGTNGTVTTLTVLNITKNTQWPANQFRFSEADYPGYYLDQ